MFKISVIGTGYVGLTTGIGLANFGCEVNCLDIDSQKVDTLKKGVMPFYEPGMQEVLESNLKLGRLNFSTNIADGIKWADIIFIAVGTPQREDGKADLTQIFNAAQEIGSYLNGYKIIVTKSTVPVGTNEEIKDVISKASDNKFDFDIVSNPEFLREGRALYDFLHPDRVVIGTENSRPIEVLKKIYRPLYLNEVPFIFTNIRTAELIKYSCNCYLALKVGFINEIARLSDAVGANIQDIAIAMGKDGRIGSKFLHPGPGFGGSCFPKDTMAISALSKEFGVNLEITEAVTRSNYIQKMYAADKIKCCFENISGKKIGVLGLAFKSETDDIRESPSVHIVEELLKSRAIIKVFDPKAMENSKKLWGNKVLFCSNEYETAKGADGLVILTEWNQFRNMDLKRIAANMKGKYFFDFRNIYQKEEVSSAGLIYKGIGK